MAGVSAEKLLVIQARLKSENLNESLLGAIIGTFQEIIQESGNLMVDMIKALVSDPIDWSKVENDFRKIYQMNQFNILCNQLSNNGYLSVGFFGGGKAGAIGGADYEHGILTATSESSSYWNQGWSYTSYGVSVGVEEEAELMLGLVFSQYEIPDMAGISGTATASGDFGVGVGVVAFKDVYWNGGYKIFISSGEAFDFSLGFMHDSVSQLYS